MINTNYSTQESASLTASLTASKSTSATTVSESDESKADLEMLHLIIALRSGTLDSESLKKQKGYSEDSAGPRRDLVERFKETIRKIRSGSDDVFAAAKNAQAGNTNAEPTLRELVDSLPEEFRNLVYSAFPNLDEMLLEEAEKLAKNATAENEKEDGTQISGTGQAQPLDEAALANQARVRALTPRYTEQWYDEPSLDA